MTKKRFTVLKKLENSDIEADVIDTYIERLVKDGKSVGWVTVGILDKGNPITYKDCVDLLNENEQLKKELKRYKHWINSDKYDYELTLSFIKNKGYSLKDVLEYEKELKSE